MAGRGVRFAMACLWQPRWLRLREFGCFPRMAACARWIFSGCLPVRISPCWSAETGFAGAGHRRKRQLRQPQPAWWRSGQQPRSKGRNLKKMLQSARSLRSGVLIGCCNLQPSRRNSGNSDRPPGWRQSSRPVWRQQKRQLQQRWRRWRRSGACVKMPWRSKRVRLPQRQRSLTSRAPGRKRLQNQKKLPGENNLCKKVIILYLICPQFVDIMWIVHHLNAVFSYCRNRRLNFGDQ